MKPIYCLAIALSLCTSLAEAENCEALYEEKDPYTNDIKYSMPMISKKDAYSIYLTRTKMKGGSKVNRLHLFIYDSFLTFDGEGVGIIFDDKSKWIRSGTVSVNSSEFGYTYSTSLRLTEKDLQKLKSSNIEQFKIDIFKTILDEADSKAILGYAACLSTR
jgi:hypothetical protein